MLDGSSLWQIGVALILLVFGFLFSMSETALTSISKASIRQMKEDGKTRKRAKILEKITENKDKFLSSVLVGNNMVTIVISAIVTAVAINIARYDNETLVLLIATGITSFVVIIFGDIIPKIIATKNLTKSSLFVARPISLLIFILSPIGNLLTLVIGKIFSAISPKDKEQEKEEKEEKERELEAYLDIAYEEDIIDEEEKIMLDKVLELSDMTAKEIMTPRVDMVTVERQSTYDEIFEVFKAEGLSRLPVINEDIDDIIGILNFRDFVLFEGDKASFKIENTMRKAFFTNEYLDAKKLFKQLRDEGQSLAIIVDEYGGTVGLVTVEDLVETIFGEIYDEYDTEDKEIKDNEIVCVVEGKEYLVLGSVKIEDFNELLGTKIESEDYDTIGGYVVGLFGYIPTKGEQISPQYEEVDEDDEESEPTPHLLFTVENVEKNRIGSLKVEMKEKEEDIKGGEEIE